MQSKQLFAISDDAELGLMQELRAEHTIETY